MKHHHNHWMRMQARNLVKNEGIEKDNARNAATNDKADKGAPNCSGINEEETAQFEKNTATTTIQGISSKLHLRLP